MRHLTLVHQNASLLVRSRLASRVQGYDRRLEVASSAAPREHRASAFETPSKKNEAGPSLRRTRGPQVRLLILVCRNQDNSLFIPSKLRGENVRLFVIQV